MLVRPVGVQPHGLAPDEVIKVVPGFLREGLPGLVTVGDLGGVNAEEPQAELGLVAGDRDSLLPAELPGRGWIFTGS